MPRPSSITPADLERWRLLIETHMETQPVLCEFVRVEDEGTIEHVLYTGFWLGEQLSALDCDLGTMMRLGQANGIAIETAADPWEVTQNTVLDYMLGYPVGRASQSDAAGRFTPGAAAASQQRKGEFNV